MPMSNTSPAPRTLALLGSLALSACAHTVTPASEAPHMTAPVAAHALPHASALLRSLATLLGQADSIADITPATVESVMKVPVKIWTTTSFGFGGPVATGWSAGLDMNQKTVNGPQLTFSFQPMPPGTSPRLAEICQFDFADFDRALKAAGFAGDIQYGEHGRVLAHVYTRGNLRVSVDTRADEADSAAAATPSACVSLVVVN